MAGHGFCGFGVVGGGVAVTLEGAVAGGKSHFVLQILPHGIM